MSNELSKLIELLSIVSEDNLDSDIAIALVERISWQMIPEVNRVYGNLFHYWHDQDVRERDPEYKAMQDLELALLIHHLKNNDFVKACSISFLNATSNT
jgi:hypothetical protein